MLRAAGPSSNEEIDEVFTDLLREEADYDRMDSPTIESKATFVGGPPNRMIETDSVSSYL